MTAALQRIGGSIGTALLAVILQQQTRVALASGGGSPNGLLGPVTPTVRERVAGPLDAAFGHTFVWATAMAAAAIVPAAFLAWTERADRSGGGLRRAVRGR
jgi:hypothetical protein